MAATAATLGGGIGGSVKSLGQKWHGLPVWAWTIIGTGGAWFGYRWYKGRSAATSTTAPSSDSTVAGYASGYGDGYTSGTSGTGYGGGVSSFQPGGGSLSDALAGLSSAISGLVTANQGAGGVLTQTPAATGVVAAPSGGQPATNPITDINAAVQGISYGGSPIAASVADPSGGYWQVTKAGNIYAFGGAPFYGGAGGDPATNFASGGRIASAISPRPNGGYTITDTKGETYNYGPDYNKPTT